MKSPVGFFENLCCGAWANCFTCCIGSTKLAFPLLISLKIIRLPGSLRVLFRVTHLIFLITDSSRGNERRSNFRALFLSIHSSPNYKPLFNGIIKINLITSDRFSALSRFTAQNAKKIICAGPSFSLFAAYKSVRRGY
jgi:hypothetical protein